MMMLEHGLNIFQMTAAAACMAIAIAQAVRRRSRLWMLYAMFAGTYFLGDLWWTLYLHFYGSSAPDSFIPYMSWDAAMLFLLVISMQYSIDPDLSGRVRWTTAVVTAVFVTVMALAFMQYGAYFNNTVTAVLMGLLIWNAWIRLMGRSGEAAEKEKRAVCGVVMLYCFVEYGEWLASCLDYDSPLRNLYFVFDFLLTVSIALLIPALGKAGER